jgi:hypothetical protein
MAERRAIVDTFLLALTAFATVAGTVGGLILQRQGNKYFAEQNRIMIEQGGVEKTDIVQTLAYKPPRWPIIAMAIMVLLCWSAAGYSIYDRHHRTERPWGDPTELIIGQSFMNTTVRLDNRHFIMPTFDSVTLEYEGTGPVVIESPTLKGNLRVYSKNPVVEQTLGIQNGIVKMMGCTGAYKELPRTNVEAK